MLLKASIYTDSCIAHVARRPSSAVVPLHVRAHIFVCGGVSPPMVRASVCFGGGGGGIVQVHPCSSDVQ